MNLKNLKYIFWIINFENNYQNDQNICDKYFILKHVLISNLGFALLCTTSDDQPLKFFSYVFIYLCQCQI
jgi:hypothetical protein